MMIEIEQTFPDANSVVFTIKLPTKELYGLYRNIFTPEYFQALGFENTKFQSSRSHNDVSFPYNILSSFVYDPTKLMSYEDDSDSGQEFIFTIYLLGTNAMSKEAFLKMKRESIQENILEQDTNGFTMNEIDELNKTDKIQQAQKSFVLQYNHKQPIPKDSWSYNINPPVFYILPQGKLNHVALNLGVTTETVVTTNYEDDLSSKELGGSEDV